MLRPVLSFSPATLFIVSWRPEKVFEKKYYPTTCRPAIAGHRYKGGDYFSKRASRSKAQAQTFVGSE